MKKCYKCGCEKPLDLFNKNKAKKDGLASECRPCKKEQDKKYFVKNAEIIKQRASDWYYKNKDDEAFKQLSKQRLKDWRSKNLDKHAAKETKRRVLKLNAMPKWLSEQQLKDIATEYELSKWCSEVMQTKYHVDHIVPLKGKTVCGLHVPWNLRVIPAKDNIIKGNRYVG